MNPTQINRIKLVALAALFFGPFFIAWLVYFGPVDWKPAGNTATGRIIDPARPMPESFHFTSPDGASDRLGELWTVLHIGEAPCGESCRHRLWQTRQMRTLLHRRRGRVQRAYVVADPAEAAPLAAELAAEHPRLKVLSVDPALRSQFEAWIGDLDVSEPVLLIDPLGNFLMVYGDELPMEGMFKDIKRLLKLSNIG